jgi:hypothetical protein
VRAGVLSESQENVFDTDTTNRYRTYARIGENMGRLQGEYMITLCPLSRLTPLLDLPGGLTALVLIA